MSKEVILKIKEAEAEARKIRSDAAEEARKKIHNAEHVGKLLCEKAETDSAKENNEKLKMTREKAEELLERSRKEAQKEAETLTDVGGMYMRDAVRLIIGGVFEKCQ